MAVTSSSHCVFLLFVLTFTSILRFSSCQYYSCRTPDGQIGQCVVIRSCPRLMAMLQNRPVPVVVTEFLRQSSCGFQNDMPKVCCSSRRSLNNRFWQSPSVNYAIPQQRNCGKDLIDKLYGGKKTDLDEFPWIALLEYTKANNAKGFHCGGVLVSSRYVMTAAHCISGPKISRNWRLTSVRLGEWNVSSPTDCSNEYCSDPPQDIPVESVVVHNSYQLNSVGQHNDIALLRLARPVTFTEWIQPICLPLISQSLAQKSYVGEELYIAGWGKTETKSESNVKLKLRVPVVNVAQCDPRYAGFGVRIAPTQLCAGGRRGQDSCHGDSGGPLMVQETENRMTNWYVIGLVSFGPIPCGMEGWPAVYTNVAQYSDWLRRNIRA